MQFWCHLWFWGWDTSDGCACVLVNALYAFLLYDCEMSEWALICIISFLSFFPSQFSAPFCPEKLNNFLFWQKSDCLVGAKMSFSAASSCCLPQARLPDRSPRDGTGARSGAAGALLWMAVPGRGRRGQRPPSAVWATPHAECLRQEAPGSQQRAHKAEEQNSMSLCSACLVGNPAARARRSAFPLPCHISSRFSAGEPPVAFRTPPAPSAQPWVRWGLALPPLGRARSCLDVPPCWVPLHVLEGGGRAARRGVSRQLGRANPSCGLPVGGCVGQAWAVILPPAPRRGGHAGPATAPPGLRESFPACKHTLGVWL